MNTHICIYARASIVSFGYHRVLDCTRPRPYAEEKTAIMFEHLCRMQRQLGRAFRLVTIDGGDAAYSDLGNGWDLEIYPSFYRGWDIHLAHHNAIMASRFDVPACRIKREVEGLILYPPD